MQSARDRLAGAGLRCTRQRELLLDALCASRTHPTAEELFEIVQADDPNISLATVYNTLDAFTGHGLAHRIAVAGGRCAARYDGDTQPHVHVTTADGRVLDVGDKLGSRLLGTVDQALLSEIADDLGLDPARLSLQLVECCGGQDCAASR